MTVFEAIAFALFGLVFGSFMNVVIYRVPRGESVMSPPSACPSCGVRIAARDNIPVVSYLLLHGRCRQCGAKISTRYALIEAASAVLAVGAAFRFHDFEASAFAALASATLLALAAIDLQHRRLPNSIVLPGMVVAAVWMVSLAVVRHEWTIAEHAFVAGAAAFSLLFVIALVSGGMGFGDVKLAGFIGIVTGRFGWQVTVAAILVSFIGGGLVAIGLLLLGKKGRKESIPFGPALAAGALIAVFAGVTPVHALLGL
jgi:leader peptidase (prepilin peptidase)/N-methyltransferase